MIMMIIYAVCKPSWNKTGEEFWLNLQVIREINTTSASLVTKERNVATMYLMNLNEYTLGLSVEEKLSWGVLKLEQN
jgi:hypothetical protein